MICFLAGCINSSVFAADDAASGDEWSDIGKMQGAWDGQKIITDDQFDKIIEQRTKKSKDKQEKQFKKKVGESIVPQNSEVGNLMTIRQIAEDYPTLLVPKTLISGHVEIAPGFYRVISAKNKAGKNYINFYQGSTLIGKIPAHETDNDFGAETINYAKIIYAENGGRAKVVYGCLEYNLAADADTK